MRHTYKYVCYNSTMTHPRESGIDMKYPDYNETCSVRIVHDISCSSIPIPTERYGI